MITTFALLYRPPSNWPIAAAFAAALLIHLAAVALASHREIPAADFAGDVFTQIVGIEDPVPDSPQTDAPAPDAPPRQPTEFVEASPAPAVKRSITPIHPRSNTAAPSAAPANARAFALSAPRPEYPYEARSRHITGSGEVALTIDPQTGTVLEASMGQSIGNSILDQSALSAFRRWRFKTGSPARVRVPITFTIAGAQY